MEARHASLGRQKLDEIRQKRAAERLPKASSGSDIEGSGRTDGSGRIVESSAILPRIKDLEKKNSELLEENRKLLSKREEKEIENDSLLHRINDLEQETLPSLQKTLQDAFIEKDAAVVAREDLLSQLRTTKKRMKEAEEEQYRAEEDAAALRAELNSLQQQDMRNAFAPDAHTGTLAAQIQTLEREILELKSQLETEVLLRMQEQQKLLQEQLRSSSFMAEKQELERRLAAFSKQTLEEASEDAAHKAILARDKVKADKKLHDMALMVERLESSRQKLLMEIDSQSTEIERLFEENSNLSVSYEDAMATAAEWEKQVKECLNQNQELRIQLDSLRVDLVNSSRSKESNPDSELKQHKESSDAARSPLLLDQLTKEKSKSEALSAEVMRLSAELKRAVQAHNNLTRLYRPVLRDIENNLMKMKQDSYTTIQ